jgi:hypothetical protein
MYENSSAKVVLDRVAVRGEVRMSRLEQVYMAVVVVLLLIEVTAEGRRKDDMVCEGRDEKLARSTSPRLAKQGSVARS